MKTEVIYTISQIPVGAIVLIDGKKFQYAGQDKIKIGLGKVSQYVFYPIQEGFTKFFNKNYDFKFIRNSDEIFELKTNTNG